MASVHGRRIDEGSLFVELFSPRTRSEKETNQWGSFCNYDSQFWLDIYVQLFTWKRRKAKNWTAAQMLTLVYNGHQIWWSQDKFDQTRQRRSRWMRSRWENIDKGSWLSFSKVKVVRVESEERNRSLYFWVATVEGCLAGGDDVVVDKLFKLDSHRTIRNTRRSENNW